MSLRGFDRAGMMRDAALSPGTDLDTAIVRQFADPAIGRIDLHFAAPGCYAARVVRQ